MALLDTIPGIELVIRRMVVQEKKTYQAVSNELNSMFPNSSGQSTRSVRRYCDAHDIHATSRLSDGGLDTLVSNCVRKVHEIYYSEL